MRSIATAVLSALLVPGLLFGQGVQNLPPQGKPAPPPIEPSTDEKYHRHYLSLDLFGGASGDSTHAESDANDGWPESWGWDAGATVCIHEPGLGVTGAFGRHTIGSVPTSQFVIGAHVAHWWADDPVRIRFFGDVLGGFAHATGEAASQGGALWGVSVGADFYFFRAKVERFWLKVSGLPENSYRVSIGGVVPLCLRACHSSDFIRVSDR